MRGALASPRRSKAARPMTGITGRRRFALCMSQAHSPGPTYIVQAIVRAPLERSGVPALAEQV